TGAIRVPTHQRSSRLTVRDAGDRVAVHVVLSSVAASLGPKGCGIEAEPVCGSRPPDSDFIKVLCCMPPQGRFHSAGLTIPSGSVPPCGHSHSVPQRSASASLCARWRCAPWDFASGRPPTPDGTAPRRMQLDVLRVSAPPKWLETGWARSCVFYPSGLPHRRAQRYVESFPRFFLLRVAEDG